MKTKRKTMPPNAARYLIGDFLEMKTGLSLHEREMLMNKIEAEAVPADSLQSQPAFWMGSRIMLILTRQPSECLFYYVQSGKMDKVRLSGAISSFEKSVSACF